MTMKAVWLLVTLLIVMTQANKPKDSSICELPKVDAWAMKTTLRQRKNAKSDAKELRGSQTQTFMTSTQASQDCKTEWRTIYVIH
ncbi:hypothetical protein ACROYT_G039169 [Oculina patagonica]